MNRQVVRSNTVSIALLVGAVVIAGLVLHRYLTDPRGDPTDPPRDVVNWQRLSAKGPSDGPRKAPVQIVEFSDFRCPFCADLQPFLEEIRNQYPDEVHFVFRHAPTVEPVEQSIAAAIASECANSQEAFDSYRNALFREQMLVEGRRWVRIARLASVPDVEDFANCVAENRYRSRVEDDRATATEIGVKGTPTIIVNGRVHVGTASMADVRARVDSLVAGTQSR